MSKAVFMCTLCTRVYFGHVNGVLRMQLNPTFDVVQLYLHPGANCAHERKPFNFYIRFDRSLICGRPFLLRICINRYKNEFQM